MKTYQLNGSKLVRSIRGWARSYPHRLEACNMAHQGEPCCIVAMALDTVHPEVDLYECGGNTFGDIAAGFGGAIRFLVSDRYMQWIDAVQQAQDGRVPAKGPMTWSNAVRYADERLGKVR